MNKPTDEQVKEFWEWCGLKYEIDQDNYKVILPDGEWYNFGEDADLKSNWEITEPEIGLNNLFKYAEHPFVSMACGSINEENWKGAWAKVITHDRQKVGEIREEGLTPALALFWAIYSIIKEVSNV